MRIRLTIEENRTAQTAPDGVAHPLMLLASEAAKSYKGR